MFDRDLLSRQRDFRNLFYGQAISQMGDALYYVSFMFMVEKLTGSLAMVGIVGAAETLPFFLLGPYSGVLADRIDRKRILFATDVLSAAVLLVLCLAAFISYPISGWSLVIAASLLATIRTFFYPAKNAAIPRLVPAEDLQRAFAVSIGTQNLMFMAGTAFSATVMAAMYEKVSPQAFFVTIIGLNAASFAWSAYFIAKLPRIEPEKQGEQQHALVEFKEGLKFIRRRADLMTLLSVSLLFGACVAPFFVTYVAANKFWFGGRPSTLAWFEFAFFLGMVLGSIAAGKRPPKRVGMAFIVGCVVVGIAIMLMAFSRNMLLFAFWNLVCGLVVPFIDIPKRSYLQATVPDAFRGRVNSVENMTVMATMPVAMSLSGSLIKRFGLVVVFAGMGLGIALASLLGLAGKEFRNARMPDTPFVPKAEPGAHELDPMRA